MKLEALYRVKEGKPRIERNWERFGGSVRLGHDLEEEEQGTDRRARVVRCRKEGGEGVRAVGPAPGPCAGPRRGKGEGAGVAGPRGRSWAAALLPGYGEGGGSGLRGKKPGLRARKQMGNFFFFSFCFVFFLFLFISKSFQSSFKSF